MRGLTFCPNFYVGRKQGGRRNSALLVGFEPSIGSNRLVLLLTFLDLDLDRVLHLAGRRQGQVDRRNVGNNTLALTLLYRRNSDVLDLIAIARIQRLAIRSLDLDRQSVRVKVIRWGDANWLVG